MVSLVICHNQIVNVLGDFVYFGASGTAEDGDRTASAYVDIYENYFDNAGRQGIAIVSGTDIAVRNNWIEEVARTALDIEPLSTHLDVANITFDDNKVIGTRRFFSSIGAPAVVSNIVVKNNELIGSAMVIAIVGGQKAVPADKRNIAIIGNTSNKECGCNRLIWLHGIDNMWLLGNTAAVGTRPGPLHRHDGRDRLHRRRQRVRAVSTRSAKSAD